jgi:two-component system sensor histidine kinase KdpD
MESVAQRAFKTVAALTVVAVLTFLFYRVLPVNSTTVALVFVLAILAIATAWGLTEAILASVLAMLCFNFFFLPPIGTLTIADPHKLVCPVDVSDHCHRREPAFVKCQKARA